MTGQAYEPDVICRVDAGLGQLLLNRPKAINSLNTAMLTEIASVLDAWKVDPAVRLVVLDGAGERGLCAGADVRSMWSSARAADGLAREFFRIEYGVNAHIARYTKPFVALMDGIVMGGGIGLSAHATVRVVTERSKVAMPEVTIGLAPDVGATFLLSHAPGEAGTHLALTASTVGAGDAIFLGLADHFVPAERLAPLRKALGETSAAEAVAAVAEPAPASELADQAWVDDCYALDTVEQIVAALQASSEPAAREAAHLILTKSPTALKVTLESLRRARAMTSVEEALEQEYRVSCAFLETPDLVEGIRAQVIDKDRTPSWNPPLLGDVADDVVAGFFADRGHGSVGLPVKRR